MRNPARRCGLLPRRGSGALPKTGGISAAIWGCAVDAALMAGFLFATFYLAMAAAALIVELIFGGFALVPSEREARVVEAFIAWNYTTWLNLAFLILAGLLVWRFLKTGGLAMLRMMNRPADHGHAHRHAH